MAKMRGLDIYNGDAGLNVKILDVEFIVAKASEGLTFSDPLTRKFMNEAQDSGKLVGLYHFARKNDATAEARFFHSNYKQWQGVALPVLDYEVWSSDDAASDVAWCETFLEEFHRLSGVWALIYISASNCSKFTSSWIPTKCDLWAAGYPRKYTDWTDRSFPYTVKPWPYVAIWQFTESLRIPGFARELDANYAYMTREAWANYAKSEKIESAPDYEQLADEVIAGKWGNGTGRRDRLDSQYGHGTYAMVQEIVNERLRSPNYGRLADEVIAGKWGNGWNRKNALNGAYGSGTYEMVQEIVNRKLR